MSRLGSAQWQDCEVFDSLEAAMATHPRPESNAAIGTRLRSIRLAYGVMQKRERPMSQAEFARLCNIGAAAWNNAETGDNRIGIDAAMSVVRRTGVSLDYIYFGNPAGLPHALAVEIEKLEKPVAKRA
jgi:transcriptional regulator with XRE-family HTH domain